MMLDANDLNFAARYPYGAIVRDRWGRRIPGVIACNPETGEVITYGMGWVAHAWHGFLWSGPKRGPLTWRFYRRFLPAGGGYLDRRHGFWPAPLTIEANWRAGTGTPGPSSETATRTEGIRFTAAIRRLDAVLKARAAHSPRE
jgi:hypothetical protein